jgi:hypothetical protein
MLGMPFLRRAPFLLTDHPVGQLPSGHAFPLPGGQSNDFASILPDKQSILFSVF